MKKILLCLMVYCALPIAVQGQDLLQYSFDQAQSAQENQSRYYAVFIHTDWCRYCHGMKKNAFTHPKIIRLLNQQFYFIDFDAESKNTIDFSGHSFSYSPSGTHTGTHELAVALGTVNGQLSYPTLVVLNAKREIVFQHNGYLRSKQLLSLLQHIVEQKI